jgi:hypothetical protein
MKLQKSAFRTPVLFAASLLLFTVFQGSASAQQTAGSKKDEPTRSRFPAAKAQPAADNDADVETAAQTAKAPKAEKDSPDVIRKRDEWFYKQRASANGHIPAGARTNALAHMQRMMEKEGKLTHRPDGSIAEVLPASSSVTNPWTSIGPTPTTGGFFSPVTGRITTIAVDPSDGTGNTVLIGGAQGGIWRSTDMGNTWTAVGDQNSSLSMGSIAFAPSAPATVYAGTGEQASVGFDIYYGAGVLKSADGGQTWAPTCATASATCPFIGPFSDATPFGFFTLGGARISYVAVNPANPLMVLAAAQFGLEGPLEGVYCSADGGANWNLINSASGEMSTFVGFASSTVAFAALGNPFGSSTNKNGIYKSTNANSCSLTFSALATGLPAEPSIGRVDIGISPSFATDNTLYASIADGTQASSPNLGVFVSTNAGTSWTKTAAPDVCNAQCWYDNVIKVDPNNKNIAFLGGSSAIIGNSDSWVVRTADGGNTWTSVIPTLPGGSAGLPHVDNHAIAFVKLSTGKVRAYLGNDGGIWRTDDAEAAAVAWTNLNDSTLTLTQFYPALSIHPSSQFEAFAGAQDNGSQIYAGPSTAWTDNGICGDGTGTAIDNVVPSTVYVTCNGNNINVSTLNGALNTFVSATNGINPADNSNFVPPLVTDPSTANVLYTGTTKVYQSVNAGLNWTALSSDLVNGGTGDSLIAMVVAPSNPKVIYAGADTGQVFVATNVTAGNGTFAAVAGQASLPPRQVSSIAVDPADPLGKTAYAAFSGFSFHSTQISDLTGHLFRTADGGATWTDVSCSVADCSGTLGASDLPNSPVNDVVIDPDIPGTLYAATDIGVFIGTCTTTAPFTCSWATLSTGLPRVATLSLKLHHASRTLRAATHGRGVWDVVLNNFTFTNPHISSISPVSVVAGSGSASLTVNGVGLTGGTVLLNGSATSVNTTPGSDAQLTATIAAALTGGGGTPQISVSTGAGTSNSLTFTVLGGAPTITSVTPTQAPLANLPATITVTGTGFAANSQVLMNPDVGGTAIPTTFVSSTSLTATIPAVFANGFGSTNSVGVENPAPGGGTTVTTQTVTLPTFIIVAAPPANDNFANATTITPGAGGVFTNTVDSSGATTQSTDPAPPCAQSAQIPFTTGISNTIWYKFTPTSSGTITDVDTIGSSYDSVLSIWTGSAGSLTNVACNDDIVSGIDVQSQLTNIAVSSGATYFIMVSSFGPADPNPLALGGQSILNFTFTSSSNGGTFTVSGAAATVTAGASTNSTVTVNSTTFAGTVAVTCGNTLPGVTCGALSIPVTAAASATGQLAINVLGPSSATTATNLSGPQNLLASAKPASAKTRAGWWTLSGGTGFAAIFLLLLPGRKRYRAALGLGLLCLLSFTIGCGGYGGGGGGGGGLASTTTRLTVSATKVAANASITVSAAVTSTGMAPAGTVQLFADGAALGSAVPLSSGSTGNITLTAAQAPAFLQLIGTHSVSAHYLGDAYTAASQSGSLNVTITGTANLPITGTAGSSSANGTVSLTIN